jgi:hypothetical protein
LAEVLTETVDVTGATQSVDREVKTLALGPHAGIDPQENVHVHIEIVPAPTPEPEKPKRGRR